MATERRSDDPSGIFAAGIMFTVAFGVMEGAECCFGGINIGPLVGGEAFVGLFGTDEEGEVDVDEEDPKMR